MSKIVVFGSCSVDYTIYAERLPHPGETLHGHKFTITNGGKGANQCVAAAKLYADASMVARVGDDTSGKEIIKKMMELGVNTKYMWVTEGHQTGLAQIMVGGDGENQILIMKGANECLSPSDADFAQDVISKAAVLVCQLETPMEATLRAFQICKGIKILNAAPIVKDLNKELFALATVVCVNEIEASMIIGKTVNESNLQSTLDDLLALGCEIVIITLGGNGAAFATKKNPTMIHVPCRKVTPVETTGAGDAFVGTLAVALATDPNIALEDAIRTSCYAASVSVSKQGAQSSYLHISYDKLILDAKQN